LTVAFADGTTRELVSEARLWIPSRSRDKHLPGAGTAVL
jgi:hypothetical protein